MAAFPFMSFPLPAGGYTLAANTLFMSLKIDRVQLDIVINNDQARVQMRKLDEEFKTLSAQQKKFAKGSEDWERLNKEILRNKTQMDNLVDSMGIANLTLSELRKRSNDLTLMKSHLRPGTVEFQNLDNELKQVNMRMLELRGKAAATGNVFSGMKPSIGGVTTLLTSFVAGLGLAQIGTAAFKAVISATDIVSDKWNETLGGMQTGLSYVARSVATLDFSNFLTNLNLAIKAGRDYVQTLDQIEDRTRSISIIESKDRERIADLQIISRTVTNTKEERIAAAKEILSIEEKNAERRKQIANDQLQNELNHASVMSGLSKDRIEGLLIEQETNREMVEKAKVYNDALSEYKAAEANQFGGSQYGQTTSVSKATLEILRQTPQAVKNYAAELNKFGKLNEEEYNRITESFQKTGEANASFAETTARTQIRLSKLNKGILDDSEAETKKYAKVIADTTKTLSQKIADADNAIQAAIESGNVPLAEKAQIEKNALLELKETYDAVRQAIEAGYMMDQRALEQMDQLVSKSAQTVESLKNSGSPLVARDNGGFSGPSQQSQDEEARTKAFNDQLTNSSIQAATDLNDTIFTITANRQQAEYDHKLSLIEKQREAELSNKNLTETQKAAINAKYDKQSSALKAKQFRQQQNASALQAGINGLLGLTKTYAEYGFTPAGVVAAVALGASTLFQIAAIKSTPVPQFFTGRGYNVTGAMDGRQYSNVPYVSNATTGMYSHPTLIGDHGSEIVIDHLRSKNIQMNYPEILAAIRAVPQHYSGRVPDAQSSSTSSAAAAVFSGEMIGAIKEFSQAVNTLKTDGVHLDYQRLKDMQVKEQAIEDSTAM